MLRRRHGTHQKKRQDDSTHWATRVERCVDEVCDRDIGRRVPRVAEPDIHTGLGRYPVLIETTRDALLLTVEGDGKRVANEPDADVGDLSNWQGFLWIATDNPILAPHADVEPRAPRIQPECRHPLTIRLSEVNNAPPRIGRCTVVRSEVKTQLESLRSLHGGQQRVVLGPPSHVRDENVVSRTICEEACTVWRHGGVRF